MSTVYPYCIHFDFFIVILWHTHNIHPHNVYIPFSTVESLFFSSLLRLRFFPLNQINVLSYCGMWFWYPFILVYPVRQTVIHHYFNGMESHFYITYLVVLSIYLSLYYYVGRALVIILSFPSVSSSIDTLYYFYVPVAYTHIYYMKYSRI